MHHLRKRIRQLIEQRDYIVAPGAYDALSARAIEKAGFEAAGTTGYGLHGVILGQPDTGLLTLSEEVNMIKHICDAVDIPILADGEGGYGNALNVYRTVQEYERAGIAGLFLEDQQQPPNCPFIKKPEVISKEEMVGKIHAAVDARIDEDMIIVARTDATDFEDAIDRANTYFEEGADMVKVLPKTREQLIKLPSLVKAPLHLGMFPDRGINDGLTADDCGKMGYKIITFPLSALFAQTYALQHFFQYLKKYGTDEGYDGNKVAFEEYLDFVGVDRIREMGDKYGLNK